MAACLVYCVSRILFILSLAMDVRCATYTCTVQTEPGYGCALCDVQRETECF